MLKNTGGPAFPMLGHVVKGEWEPYSQFTGMTMRDYFASVAMQNSWDYWKEASEANAEIENSVFPDEYMFDIAKDAYSMADAMIKASRK